MRKQQTLPPDMEARASKVEHAFVGALMLAAEWANEECPSLWGLTSDDFRDDRYRAIFTGVQTLFESGKRFSHINLVHTLEDQGTLKMVGGESALIGIWNNAPSFVTIPDLADTILEYSAHRAVISASGLAASIVLGGGSADEAIEEAEAILTAARKRRAPASSAILRPGDSQEFVYQIVDELDKQVQNNTLIVWATPWPDVNRMIGSFRAGHMFTLAGYPGHGKTAMFEQIAEHNARQGANVAFFHAEHSHRWMMFRRIMHLTGAHIHRLERGECIAEALEAEEIVNTWPGSIYYIHCPGWDADQVARTMADLHATGACDIAIVDYLQKLQLERKSWNKADLLGNAVETIKTAGERLAIPVLLGSQLNRAGHLAGRPGLEHLRGSGEIEEKSNHCLFVYRDKVGDRELSATAEIYQEKPYAPGTELYFNSDRLTFYGTTHQSLNL